MKKCSRCKKTRPFDDFAKHSGRKDGFNDTCKECLSPENYQWQKEEKELLKQKQKRCTVCEEVKTFDDFNWDDRINQPRAQCKLCQYRNGRSLHLKKYYNITLEDFENLLIKQNNKCLICNNVFEDKPHIDHDHKTGKIRGLLCNNCNLGLGKFKDSIDILENAIKYLKLWLIVKN